MTTPTLKKFIEAWEADRLTGYLCPAGVPTISRGLTTAAIKAAKLTVRYTDGVNSDAVRLDKSISQSESDRLYASVLSYFSRRVQDMLRRSPTQPQLEAFVSLAWNIGLEAFRKSTALKRFNAREPDDRVTEAIRWWNKATIKGKRSVLRGLVRRRDAEAALFMGDLIEAELIIGLNLRGPMPQQVDAPEAPKSITSSKTAGASVIAGAAGGAAAAREAVDTASTLVDAGASVGQAIAGASPWLVVLLVVIGCAAFIVWDRSRRLREDLA